MKIKSLFIPLMVFALSSCGSHVNELYYLNQYENPSNFNANYYTERGDFDSKEAKNAFKIEVTPRVYNCGDGDNIEGLKGSDQYDDNNNLLDWDLDYPVENYKNEDPSLNGYGPYNALIHKDRGFSYGYLSKLYDGRIQCDGFVTKSRVQLDGTGYATYFPKALNTYSYFGIALRGGTEDRTRTYSFKRETDPEINIHLSFLKHDQVTGEYSKFNFEMENVKLMTNNGGKTCFVFFYFEDVLKEQFPENYNTILKDTIAMSLTFDIAKMKDEYVDLLSLDRNSEKDHFAIMLYEVMLPKSTWL